MSYLLSRLPFLIISFLLFSSASVSAQSAEDNYLKLETLFNKAKGQVIGSMYSKKKIGKQTFTSTSASLNEDAAVKGEESYLINYTEINWQEMTYYFEPAEGNDQVYGLTIKLKGAAQYARSIIGTTYGTKTYSAAVNLYCKKEDSDQIRTLLDAIK
jgi:hypothetical protein